MALQKVVMYYIRHFDPVKKKWIKTRWKMTEANAAARYKDTQWELAGGAEERTIGWGIHDNTPGAFRNHPDNRPPDKDVIPNPKPEEEG